MRKIQTSQNDARARRRISVRGTFSLNVGQLISIGLVMFLARPDLPPGGVSHAQEMPRQAVSGAPPEPARRPVTRPLLAPQRAVPMPWRRLPGQSETVLPNGLTLFAGGTNGVAASPAAYLREANSARTSALASGLGQARAWHTATLLPNGTVFVLGGINGASWVSGAELYDPSVQKFENASVPAPAARAEHTATVLTDGRLLLAGGVGDNRKVLGTLEIWDFQTGTVVVLGPRLNTPRRGHTAILQADGMVRLHGGYRADGSGAQQDELFDPEAQTITEVAEVPAEPDAQLAASIPADGAADVNVQRWIALRFSAPVDVTSVSSTTITLNNDAPIPVRVVPVENGRLAFITPDQPLQPGTSYTVLISGVRDSRQFPLPPAQIHFTTASAPTARAKSGSKDAAPKDDPPPPPLQGPAGTTALYGGIRTVAGKYLSNVTVNLDCSGKVTSGKSDALGRFLLVTTAPSGHCSLETDGATAQDTGNVHGAFFHGVDIVAGRTNVLPYTVWMTPIDQQNETTITTSLNNEVVVTNPNIKGLELHLPRGTVIRDYNGNVINKISITRVPSGRTPFPMPKGVGFGTYFTIQPGGAYVEIGGSRYTPGKGATLVYPNVQRAPAGTKFNFWDYDPDGRGWYVYGTGRVTADRKSIVPDPGTAIGRFTGAMTAPPDPFVPPFPSSPTPTPGLPDGPADPPTPCDDCDGDPVTPSTGMFSWTETDISLRDVLPVSLTRTYRSGDPISRSFGVGTAHLYDIFLVGDTFPYTYQDLVLPNGSRVHFPRVSSGTSYTDAVYQHTGTLSMFYGATIVWNGSGWTLKLKNGTLYVFPDSYQQTILAKMGISQIKDRYGNAIRMTRDAATGNLLQVSSPNGRWIAFTYDASGRIVQAKDNAARTWQYAYDEGGRLNSVTDPMNGVSSFTYDANNQMLTMTDRNNHVRFTNQFDANGHVFQQTAADAGVWQYSYTQDINGNIVQTDITNPRGYVRRLAFDPASYFSGGRIVAESLALGQPEQQVTTYAYDPATNLLAGTTDALGRTTTYQYDSGGNTLAVTRLSGTPNATTLAYTYDAVSSDVATFTDPLGHRMSYDHNSLGELASVADPTGRTLAISYNSAGQPITYTAASGAVNMQYTGGLLSSLSDLGGNVTRITTDSAGRLSSVTDPLGTSSFLQYDALSRMSQYTDGAGASIGFGYDANGNTTSVTDALTHATGYGYDAMDRATSRTDPLLAAEAVQYDKGGNLVQKTDRKQQATSVTYDGLDRPSLVTFADGSTVAYTYDGGDRATQIVDSRSGTISRTYDGMDRVLTETTPRGTVTYTYDNAGRRATMQVSGQPQITYGYDSANRLLQVSQAGKTVSIGYDNAGRRASLTLSNNVVLAYSYDTSSRLLGIIASSGPSVLGTLTYTYDAAGRRVGMGGTLARTSLPTAVASATYNAGNQLITWNSSSLTYDANGNMTSDGSNSYVWDARNELVSASGLQYGYDSAGRRISKGTTTFLYDGLNPVQEQSGGIATANLLSGPGMDETFQRTDAAGAMSLLRDGLNSTVALLDSTGTVQTQYTYDPFGNASLTGQSSANSYQFTGRENDGNGLLYYRARYYSPTFQRFISEDPLVFGGGSPNLYSYVMNSPMNWTDPTGQAPRWPLKPGSQECKDLAQKILNTENQIIKRAKELVENPGGLPDTAPGLPDACSQEGHRKILRKMGDDLKNQKDLYNNKCKNDPPPGSPVGNLELNPQMKQELVKAGILAGILAAILEILGDLAPFAPLVLL